MTTTQTDRELLELAAKAAGIDGWYEVGYLTFIKRTGGPWRPLDDDGDAMRLAFALKIDIQYVGSSVRTVARNSDGTVIEVWDIGCVAGDAGLRRMIVLAAAAIGRAMP